MDETYQDVVAVLPPKQSREGGAVLLEFKTGDGNTHRVSMKAPIARYLGTQLQLQLQLLLPPKVEAGGQEDGPYQDMVDVVPPERSPDGETVLLKFKIANDDIVHLRMSADIARQFGMQLLRLPAPSGNR